MKLFTKLIASAAVFITMSCCFALSAQAYDPVPIDEEHFPDKALRLILTRTKIKYFPMKKYQRLQ